MRRAGCDSAFVGQSLDGGEEFLFVPFDEFEHFAVSVAYFFADVVVQAFDVFRAVQQVFDCHFVSLRDSVTHSLFYVFVRWDNDVEPASDYAYVDSLAEHDGVSVEVCRAIVVGLDDEVLATEGLDIAVLVDCLGEQLDYEGRDVEWGEWLDDGDIHQSVVYGGLWCDEGIVAILCGVGTCDEESLGLDSRTVICSKAVGRGRIVEQFGQGALHVGREAAFAGIGETHAHRGVEARAACAEEWLAVNHPVVYCPPVAHDGCPDGCLLAHWDLQVACQPVARAAWDDGQCRL